MAQPTLSQIVALLHFDAANGAKSFVEEKGATVTLQGDSFISTARSAFGSASSLHLLYNGGGAYFANTDLNGWTGDFTAEAFVYVTESSDRRTVIGLNNTSGGGNLCINAGLLEWYPAGGSGAFTHQTSVSLFAFHHVALVRYNGVISLYLDGVKSSGSHSTSASLFNSSLIWVGGVDGGQVIGGHIDEVRITKNAVYTANFTVPTSAFSLPSESTGVEMSGQYPLSGSMIADVSLPSVSLIMSGECTPSGIMSASYVDPGGANVQCSGAYSLGGVMYSTYTPASISIVASGQYSLAGYAQAIVGYHAGIAVIAMSGAYSMRGALVASVWRPVKSMLGVVGGSKYSMRGVARIDIGESIQMSGKYLPKPSPRIQYPYIDSDCLISTRDRVTGVIQ